MVSGKNSVIAGIGREDWCETYWYGKIFFMKRDIP